MAEPRLPELLTNKEKAKDFGLQTLQGVAAGLRMLTESLGAENPLAQKIRGCEGYLESLLSAEAKKDKQKIANILESAQKEGALQNVLAGLQAVATAPEALAATALGTAIPHLAGGLWAKAAQLGKIGILGTQAALGTAQGAGAAKGTLYRAVANELLNHPHLKPDQIERAAQEAQAYNGKNLDQILLSAGLGGAAAATGAEKILTRILTREGKPATAPLLQTVLKGGLGEAALEGLQGAQQKTTENLALHRNGVPTPPLQGALAQGTLEATAGLLLGSAAGVVEVATQAPKPHNPPPSDIEKLSFDDLENARFQETLPHMDAQTLQANLLTPSPWAHDPEQTPTFAHHLAAQGDLDKLPPQCLTPTLVSAQNHQGQSVAMLATKTHQTALVAPHLQPHNLLEQDKNGDTLTQFALRQNCLHLLPPNTLTKKALAIPNNEGNTPTHTLFSTNHLGKIDQNSLLDSTSLTQKNKNGDTPPLLGAEAGSLHLLNPKFFTKEILSQSNNNQENCLHKALESQNFHRFPWRQIPAPLLQELLNQPNNKQKTPLQLAQTQQKENQIPTGTLEKLKQLSQTPNPGNPVNPSAPETPSPDSENPTPTENHKDPETQTTPHTGSETKNPTRPKPPKTQKAPPSRKSLTVEPGLSL